MKLYSFIYLQKQLKEHGLRSTRPYLNMLEQSGILSKPKCMYVSRFIPTFGTIESRAYTEKELRIAVRKIKDHEKNRDKKRLM